MNIVLCTSLEQEKYKLLQALSITITTSNQRPSLLMLHSLILALTELDIETDVNSVEFEYEE